nr:NYN domain-containing protein [uncultured Niameybacter sp.]
MQNSLEQLMYEEESSLTAYQQLCNTVDQLVEDLRLMLLEAYKSTESEDKLTRCSAIGNKLKGYQKMQEILRVHPQAKNYVTVLVLDTPELLINIKQCCPSIIQKKTWLNTVTQFFQDITQLGLCIEFEEGIKCEDYFLFNQQGEVKQFVGLTCLKFIQGWYEQRQQKFVLDRNIRSFRRFIEGVYNVVSSTYAEAFNQKSFYHHPLHILYTSPYSYINFEEVLQTIEDAQYLKETSKEKKIGIFMDGTNILYNIEPLWVDFHKLYQEIYGTDAIKHIGVKICTIFKSQQESKEQQYRTDAYIDEVCRALEKEGFEITIVENEEQKANQVDDQVLIKCIESYKQQLDRILILTGDRHFLDVMRAYRDEGKEVRVISVSENNTSKDIIRENGIIHDYIYEYEEVVQFTRV